MIIQFNDGGYMECNHIVICDDGLYVDDYRFVPFDEVSSIESD